MARGAPWLKYDHPPHLPPPSAVPILEHYDPEKRRLDDAHLLDAPVDDRSVVDIFRTVEVALSHVDDAYVWPAFEGREEDVHHFVWERDSYHPRHFGGSTIPRDYRDLITFHKGYAVREFHDLLHALFRQPEVPDFAVMESKVRNFKIAKRLFASAQGVSTAIQRPHKIKGVGDPETGELLLDEEILLQVMLSFETAFRRSLEQVGDGNEFVPLELVEHKRPEEVATLLGRVAGTNAVNLMPHIYGKRRKPLKVA